MEMEDFEELLEKVLAGGARPEDCLRLKNAVDADPQWRERCRSAMEAYEIIRKAGLLAPVGNLTVPPAPQHRKKELLAAVRRIQKRTYIPPLVEIDTLEPLDLLKMHGRFEHAQVFGKILGYDPVIKTARLALKLGEWDYDEADETEQADLQRWTSQKPGFKTIMERFFDAATPSLSARFDYRKALLDIRKHLELPGYPDESYAVIESQILRKLMEIVRDKYSKMPDKDKAKFKKSIEDELHNEGKTLGGVSLEQLLLATGGAGLVSALGAEIVTGIILSNLGVGHAVLLALGLYSVPTYLIGGAIFAPILASFGVYFATRSNYSKTIPFVVTLAALRQQQINAAILPGG